MTKPESPAFLSTLCTSHPMGFPETPLLLNVAKLVSVACYQRTRNDPGLTTVNRNPRWETKTSPPLPSITPLPVRIEAGPLPRPSAADAAHMSSRMTTRRPHGAPGRHEFLSPLTVRRLRLSCIKVTGLANGH